MQAINQAIHSATKEAGCTPEVRFKPKPYWCPELNRLREKKTFLVEFVGAEWPATYLNPEIVYILVKYQN